MENASKALIIAGAILISIILISIGIMVVNATNDTTGSVTETMNQQEIEMFNSQFTTFIGAQRGSSIRNLMSKVNASNGTHDEEHQITVEGPNGEATSTEILNNIKATTTYTVSVDTNTSGRITKIIITGGSGSGTSSGSGSGSGSSANT